jgi:hypothetical protein
MLPPGPEADERLLDHVLGVTLPPQHPGGEALQGERVLAEDLLQDGGVSGPQARHGLGVGETRGRRGVPRVGGQESSTVEKGGLGELTPLYGGKG